MLPRFAFCVLLLSVPHGISGNCDPKSKKTELLPTEKRVLRSSIAIKALVSNLYPSPPEMSQQHSQIAELWILDVYKGADKLAAALGVGGAHGGIFNLRDQRVNVSHEDSRCWNALIRQRTYIFLLTRNVYFKTSNKKFRLTAKYDYGAAIDFNHDVENRILSSLGWKPWSEWEPCSRWCGGGQQKRQRICSLSDGKCSGGYNVERRSCNSFSCQGSIDTLTVKEERYYKPSPSAFQRTQKRGSWLIKPGSYFLLPYRQAFGRDFPKDFTIFLTLKPAEESEGIIFSLNARNSRQEYISLELNEGGHLELIHSLSNGTKIIDIPAQVGDGKWHQISLSIEGGSTVRTYLDCHWITTQILHKQALNVPQETDLIIGYMFQGEMEQLTVHDKSSAVSEQCSPTRVPLRKDIKEENDEESTTTLEPPNDFDIIEEDHPSPFRKIHRIEKNKNDEEEYDNQDESRSKSRRRLNEDRFRHLTEDYLNEEYVDLDIPIAEELRAPPMKSRESDHKAPVREGSGESDDEDEESDSEGSGSGERYELEWSSWGKCGGPCGKMGYRIRSARCVDNGNVEECVIAGMERKQEKKSCFIPCADNKRENGSHRKYPNSHRWIPIPKNRKRPEGGAEVEKASSRKRDSNESKIFCLNGGKLKTILLAKRCACPTGYKGKHCETAVCRPDGCENGGTCVEPDVCTCPGGYTGARCQKAFCYPDCQNGGSCSSPFTCSCPEGVMGKYCEEFACSPNCSNGGVCIGHNVCSCPHGYSGVNCQEQTCTLHCENGGICTMPGNKCKCPEGFYGSRCHKKVCQRYVAVRKPHHRMLQKVINVRYDSVCEGGIPCVKTRPEYRNFRKTVYRNVYKCADDQSSSKHKRRKNDKSPKGDAQ